MTGAGGGHALAFSCLEDVLSVFAQTTDLDRAAKFAQGDALLLASDPPTLAALGFARRSDLFVAVGRAVGLSRRALLYRAQVAETFAPDDRALPVAWEVYRAASGMVEPLYWLTRAADEHLSAEKLRAVYKQAQGEDPAAVEVSWPLRNVDATVVGVRPTPRGVLVTFQLPTGARLDDLVLGVAGQLSYSVAIAHERAQMEAA